MEAVTVNKDMIIAELIQIDPIIYEILLREGMHCVTCGSAFYETLEQACYVHGLDVNDVVDDINMVLAQDY